MIAKRLASASGTSLNQIQLDTQETPDFNNLPGAELSNGDDSDRRLGSDREG
jgi:hypothetical protein